MCPLAGQEIFVVEQVQVRIFAESTSIKPISRFLDALDDLLATISPTLGEE